MILIEKKNLFHLKFISDSICFVCTEMFWRLLNCIFYEDLLFKLYEWFEDQVHEIKSGYGDGTIGKLSRNDASDH